MKHMQMKKEQRSLKTSLADKGFLDHYHTALIFHLKEEKPFQRQRATCPPLPSHAAKPFLSHRFAQAQLISVTAYSYKSKGLPMAGRKGLIYPILVQSSASHQQVFNKQQESIKMHPVDFMVTLQICFIAAQIL